MNVNLSAPTPHPSLLVLFFLQRRFSDPLERVVVALKDFIPTQDTDIALHKDDEYILTDSSQPNWWTVQDRDG